MKVIYVYKKMSFYKVSYMATTTFLINYMAATTLKKKQTSSNIWQSWQHVRYSLAIHIADLSQADGKNLSLKCMNWAE